MTYKEYKKAALSENPELRKEYEALAPQYEIILFWSEPDEAYIAEVPELPGCMADGATMQEALENAQTVISEWVETAKAENLPIPKPKGRLR